MSKPRLQGKTCRPLRPRLLALSRVDGMQKLRTRTMIARGLTHRGLLRVARGLATVAALAFLFPSAVAELRTGPIVAWPENNSHNLGLGLRFTWSQRGPGTCWFQILPPWNNLWPSDGGCTAFHDPLLVRHAENCEYVFEAVGYVGQIGLFRELSLNPYYAAVRIDRIEGGPPPTVGLLWGRWYVQDDRSGNFHTRDYPCPGDMNGDGWVDQTDLGQFLPCFGRMVSPGDCGDFNFDGAVDQGDLGYLLGAFGRICQP